MGRLGKLCTALFGTIFVSVPSQLLAQETTTFKYDALGRLTDVSRTGGANNKSTAYVYDAADNRKTVVTVNNSPVVWGSFNWQGAAWNN